MPVRLTESDARAVLLLRAFESDPTTGLAAGDAAWAGQQARRQLGEAAAPEAWLACRARLALARLAERQAPLRPWLHSAVAGGGHRLAWLLLPLAALAGLLGDASGTARSINLLAPPLLGLLLWNGLVYALLLLQALRGWIATRPAGPSAAPVAAASSALSAAPLAVQSAAASGSSRATPLAAAPAGPLRHGLLALAARWQRHWQLRALQALALPPPPAAAGAGAAAAVIDPTVQAACLARFQRDWWAASLALQTARLAAWLHAAAALLALGALAGLYARGLVFDYRAGWDSTFLQADAVHSVLAAVLGPAAALTGQMLPDAAALPALRLASGGGESAARWIHLWALTLLGAVVLPRLALAAAAAWRTVRLARDLPLPDDMADLQPLLRAASGRPLPVTVLPYSFQLDAQASAALAGALARHLGPGVLPQLLPSLPLGAEDDLPRGLPAAMARCVVALFNLSATPERETHGGFVRALAAGLPPGGELRVMVDQSAFAQRFGHSPERLAQRRQAWLNLLAEQGRQALFIDLSPAAPDAARPTGGARP